MSTDAIKAAMHCLAKGSHRSAVSRAYYAVFSAVTARLHETGKLTAPKDRGAWPHESLPRMYMTHLRPASDTQRANDVCARIRSAYRERISADYVPAIDVTEGSARRAIAIAESVLVELGVRQ